jgi:hypothetical protein
MKILAIPVPGLVDGERQDSNHKTLLMDKINSYKKVANPQKFLEMINFDVQGNEIEKHKLYEYA